MTATVENAPEVLKAATDMLTVLWKRAMDNSATAEEIRAIRHGCVAIAVARHGEERVLPFPDWDKND